MAKQALLSLTYNRTEDFDANARGELTSRQCDRLRHVTLLDKPASQQAIADARVSRGGSRRGVILVSVVILFLLLMAGSAHDVTLLGLTGCVVFILFSLIAIVGLKNGDTQAGDELKAQFKQRDAEFYSRLASAEINNAIQREQSRIRLERRGSDDPVRLYIGLQDFDIAEDLASALRSEQNEMVAYFLRTPHHGNLLLSIQSLDYVRQMRLSEAVGISDDGEIIYRDELSDDSFVADMSPLKQKRDE